MDWRSLMRRAAGFEADPPATRDAGPVEQRFTLDGYPGHDALYLGLTSDDPGVERVNESTAMGVAAVYRAVSIIAGTIASLPLKQYRLDPDGTRVRNRASWIVTTPGGSTGPTPYEWTETLVAHLCLHGEAFVKPLRNVDGSIVGSQLLHPGLVEITDASTPLNKYFRVQTAGGVQHFTSREIEHIPAITLDGIRGVSPIGAARVAMQTALAGDKAARRMFSNGLLLGGIASPTEPLSDEQLSALADGLRSKLTGGKRAGDVAVVNADLKFHPWTMPSRDAQFLESRGFQVAEISRFYGVPKVLLSEDGASTWGTGIAEIIRGMARFTLMPLTSRLESRLGRLIPSTQFLEFDYSQLLQPSPEVEIDTLLKQVERGVLTIDEFRAIRNMAPLSGGSNE